MRPLRVLTWHVHGSYLYYLAQSSHVFYLPTRPEGAGGYGGRTPSFRWPDTVREVPAEAVRDLDFDVILFQAARHWEQDQFELLSPRQQRLPRLYLEHDPPRESPTETRHPVQDPDVLVVHVTAFNQLMWDNGAAPSRVIDHGVIVPDEARYHGSRPKGLVAINHLARRGRRLGADVHAALAAQVPLDLVGMGFADSPGGICEVPPMEMPAFASAYRFLLNPVRYTSLSLAVIEAMMVGLPIVGLATTELVTVIENGVSGYLATDPQALVAPMRELIRDPALARRLGEAARERALERFSIQRFVREWTEAFHAALDLRGRAPAPQRASLASPATSREIRP